MHYDVFNGDADGLAALQQLRLSEPRRGELVTGAKRDVQLLERVAAADGDTITVLDISLAQNRTALLRALHAGAQVCYFDHHYAGEPVSHPRLQCFIHTERDTCTSLNVDRYLGGVHRAWALVGAFGDSLTAPAQALATELGMSEIEAQRLRELGECLNYNAYGETVEDLRFHPAELHKLMRQYADPLTFIANERVFEELKAGYESDMAQAALLRPQQRAGGPVYFLPDAGWGRRVSGMLASSASQQCPNQAVAVLRERTGGFVVSVRAPRERPIPAHDLCREFATGGGRAAAAGINHLDPGDLDRFLRRFDQVFAPDENAPSTRR